VRPPRMNCADWLTLTPSWRCFQRGGSKTTASPRVECEDLLAGAGVVCRPRNVGKRSSSNLLSNAPEVTFDGEIGIALSEHEAWATLRRHDTGVGIPESELPNMFGPFPWIRGGRSRSHEGQGSDWHW